VIDGTGLRTLMRLVVRRDRWLLAVWVVVGSVLPVTLAAGDGSAYTTDAARHAFAESAMANAAEVAMRGFIYGPSVGALAAWSGGSISLFLAVVSVLMVLRHTRADEQAGRRELVAAGVVGRDAPLLAAVAVVLLVNAVMSALGALFLILYGLPAAGSAVFAGSFLFVGVTGTVVAAIVAQVAQNPGTARGLAFIGLAVLFAVRAVGDVNRSWVSWLSPLGWARFTRAYAGDRWWVFSLFAAFTVAGLGVAVALSGRRDVAAGLVAPRLGPAHASSALRNVWALGWRLQRASLITWTVTAAALGLLIGGASRTIGTQMDSPQLQEVMARIGTTRDPVLVLFSAVLAIIAEVIAAYAITAAMRLRDDELAGLAGPLLATPVSRWAWSVSALVWAFIGPAIALAVLGATTGLGYGTAGGDTVAGSVGSLTMGTLTYLPAVWTFAAVVVLMSGVAPRAAAAVSWTLFGLGFLVGILAEFAIVTGAALKLSPFAAAPNVLVGESSPTTWLLWTLLAVALSTVGVIALRKRDLAAG
jgi:ABC-2 type transport system permease protein